MRIYDECGHFKSVEKVRWWAHKSNFRNWSGPSMYFVCKGNKHPRLFNLIKRVV